MPFTIKQIVLATALALGVPLAQADCTTPDTRSTVVIGIGGSSNLIDTGVANYSTRNGCTINDLIAEEDNWGNHGEFVRSVSKLSLDLFKNKVISRKELGRIVAAAARSDVGKTMAIGVISFNDFHGSLESPGKWSGIPAGGVDYLAAYVEQLRAKNPNHVVVSAGDLIGASPLVSALFHDEPTIEAMNRLGLEINAVGNHEFDDGKDELLRMQNGGCHPTDINTCQGASVGTPVPFEGAQFHFLAANVVDTSSGKTVLPAYTIKKFKGNKVAFIGMTLKNTPSIVTPSGVAGLDFKDEADTVNALVPKLKRHGVKAVVVLVHEGGFASGGINGCKGVSGPIAGIVSRLDDEVDLVVSGHTHQAYNCMLPNMIGRTIPVTSAGSYGRLLTEIDLTLDTGTKDIIAAKVNNLIVDRTNTSITPVPALTTLVANYKALSAPVANQVIGFITADITKVQNGAGESALGDLIADAQLEATQAAGFGDAVAAFMNPGGIRADLTYAASATEGDGNVTYGEAFIVQPFGNSLVTMSINGSQLKTLLEQQFVGCGQTANRILQVSHGFEYTWNNNGASCDKVIASSMKINGLPVDAIANYRVTVNSFMADGGDNFLVLKEGTSRLGGAQDIDALKAYFSTHSQVAPGAQNRIGRQN